MDEIMSANCCPTPVVTEDVVKSRRWIFLISLLDFFIAFLMLSIWSFRLFPIPLMDDSLVDHFGIFGAIWLFLLYSLQLIMAMILCGGTQMVRGEESAVKFKRWLRASIILSIMLILSNFLFFFTVGLEIESLPAYFVNLLQIIFRIFAIAFLVASNQRLIFVPYATRLRERIVARNIGICGDLGLMEIGGRVILPPPPYIDFPPTYEEVIKSYHSKQ